MWSNFIRYCWLIVNFFLKKVKSERTKLLNIGKLHSKSKFHEKMLFNPPNFLFPPFHSLYFFVHFSIFGFKRWEKNLLKNSKGKRKLSISSILATKKNDFCISGFLFSIEIQWRWCFFSNMLVKIDQVCLIFYDLVDFFYFWDWFLDGLGLISVFSKLFIYIMFWKCFEVKISKQFEFVEAKNLDLNFFFLITRGDQKTTN